MQKTRNIYSIKIDIDFESIIATSEAVTGSLLFVNLYIEYIDVFVCFRQFGSAVWQRGKTT